jgi:hypothetical protein
MKLKEKLAEEYSLDFTETVQGVLSDAYLAGFEKARQMAIETMKDTPHAYFRLRDLGEEEASSD